MFLTKKHKLAKLDQIKLKLQQSNLTVGLIGFGSLAEPERMDIFSDLDFIVVSKKGLKSELINDLDWILTISPIDYYYQAGADNFKVFFKDGLLCDFGILEEKEIKQFPHEKGKIIWSESSMDHSVADCTIKRDADMKDEEWYIGETVFHLYTGLQRYARGEKLSGLRSVQIDAVNCLISLLDLKYEVESAYKDPFQIERRVEWRHPSFSNNLQEILKDYHDIIGPIINIIDYMENELSIHLDMLKKVREYAYFYK